MMVSWWSGQAAAQTSGGSTLLYFLGGETGRMRPSTLICAAHHLVLYAFGCLIQIHPGSQVSCGCNNYDLMYSLH